MIETATGPPCTCARADGDAHHSFGGGGGVAVVSGTRHCYVPAICECMRVFVCVCELV